MSAAPVASFLGGLHLGLNRHARGLVQLLSASLSVLGTSALPAAAEPQAPGFEAKVGGWRVALEHSGDTPEAMVCVASADGLVIQFDATGQVRVDTFSNDGDHSFNALNVRAIQIGAGSKFLQARALSAWSAYSPTDAEPAEGELSHIRLSVFKGGVALRSNPKDPWLAIGGYADRVLAADAVQIRYRPPSGGPDKTLKIQMAGVRDALSACQAVLVARVSASP